MGFDNNFEKGIMMGLNFHDLPDQEELKIKPQSSRADNRKTFKFPEGVMTTPPKEQVKRKRPIITEDTESDEEEKESEESYFEIEDTPELDHPARNTGRTQTALELVSNNNDGARSTHSANSLSSNSSWNGLKYTESTPTEVLKNALIADGIK